MKTRNTAIALAIAFIAGGAAAQNQPIRVGVVTPLSGTYAGIGQQVKWGLDLAARQINAAGGVAGRQLELVYEDEEANPAVAVQKAEKLFQVNKVDFLTGTVNSGATLAVGQVAERNNRLIATTVSFADSITGDKCSPNVFRVNARAGMQSAALADWMASTRPNANVFYLGPDYEMGRSTVAAFKSAAEAKGAKSVGEVFAPLDNKDYNESGLTILLVEQNARKALELTTRAYVLDQGQICFEGNSKKLAEDPQMIAHYLGEAA